MNWDMYDIIFGIGYIYLVVGIREWDIGTLPKWMGFFVASVGTIILFLSFVANKKEKNEK
jgi:hypothetical protein